MSDDWNKLKHLVDLSAENTRLKADAQLVVKHLGEACADNLRLKADVVELADALKLASEVGIKVADEVTRLKAEVERLKEGNDCLDKMHEKEMERSAWLREEFNRTTAWGRGLESDLSHARVEISFLKAEVERLRKAGDACADAAYAHCMCQDCEELRDQWRDAKEGKQP